MDRSKYDLETLINDRIHNKNCLENNLQRLEKEIKEEEDKLQSYKNKLEILNNRERKIENYGEGSVKIELKNNKIFVYHGTDGTLLYQRNSNSETWNCIWKTIKNERL